MGELKLGASYFGVRDPEHAKRDLEEMKESGCNSVVHTFSENDYYFYTDTVRGMVQDSKNLGFETYIAPWGVGGVFSGEAFPAFPLNHPKSRQKLSSGEPAPASCLNDRGFREFVKSWIEKAATTGADYIFWDEPFFYPPPWMDPEEKWGCRCDSCSRKFEKKFGSEIPEEVNSQVVEFKEDSVFDFLSEMIGEVNEKGMKNSVCLTPDFENPGLREKKWERYANLEGVEVLGVDPYFLLRGYSLEKFSSIANNLKELAEKNDIEPQVCIQGFLVEEGDEESIFRSVKEAHSAGIENILIWGYKGSKNMSRIRSDRPDKLWKGIGKTFNELRER